MSYETAKPYVVTLRCGTEDVEEHVDAYGAMEAVMQANVRLVARGKTPTTIIDVSPDHKALADRATYQRELVTADIKEMIRSVTQPRNKP